MSMTTDPSFNKASGNSPPQPVTALTVIEPTTLVPRALLPRPSQPWVGGHIVNSIDIINHPCRSHPLSIKIYGESIPTEELINSIALHGLLQPIIIWSSAGSGTGDDTAYGGGFIASDTAVVLAGHTRLAAWRILLAERKVDSHIPCKVMKLTALEAEQFVIQSNFQRIKTAEVLAREFMELRRIESELAHLRMIAGQAADPGSNLSRGRAADIAAKALRLSRNTAKKIVRVVEAADQGSAEARAALNKVNAGETSISRAHGELFSIKEEPGTAPTDDVAWQERVDELAALLRPIWTQSVTVHKSSKPGRLHIQFRNLDAKGVGMLADMIRMYFESRS
jgi:ParB-like chromosome segregation protein Spo0J